MLNSCCVFVVCGSVRLSLCVLLSVRFRFFWCSLMWKFGLNVCLVMCVLCILRMCDVVKLFISVWCMCFGLVFEWVVNSSVLLIVLMFSVMMIWFVILQVWFVLLLLMSVMFLFIFLNSGFVCLNVFFGLLIMIVSVVLCVLILLLDIGVLRQLQLSVLICFVNVCVLSGEIEFMLIMSLLVVRFFVMLLLVNSMLCMFGVFGIIEMMMLVCCVILVEFVMIFVLLCRLFGIGNVLFMMS